MVNILASLAAKVGGMSEVGESVGYLSGTLYGADRQFALLRDKIVAIC